MESVLNKNTFDCIESFESNGIIYSTMKEKYPQMILYSRTNAKPLVTFSMRYRDKSLEGKCLFAPLLKADVLDSSRTHFQGMCDMNGQEIEFGVSNLTSDYIHYNLLKVWTEIVNGKEVERTEPINEINTVKKYGTSWCGSDVSNKNQTIILEGVTTNVMVDGKPTIEKLTVEDKKNQKSIRGTNLILVVYPIKNNTEFEDSFKNSFWVCKDVFVHTHKIEGTPRGFLTSGFIKKTTPDPNQSDGTPTDYDYEVDSIDRYDNPHYNPSNFSLPNPNYKPSNFSLPNPNYNPGNFSHQSEVEANNVADCKFPASGNQRDSIHPRGRVEADGFSSSRPIDEPSKSDEAIDKIINQSNVAEIRGGREIKVNAERIDLDFSYDAMSQPCFISLSIAQNSLKIISLNAEELAKQKAIDLLIGKEVRECYASVNIKELINNLCEIYKDDVCAVCDCPEPSIIFYRCGHQCCHKVCIEGWAKACNDKQILSCPLCRGSITAYLDTAFIQC